MRLGEKFQFDLEHADLSARLAGKLFDQSAALHQLGGEYKLLLEIASLLHDIGHFINTLDHNKHGYYILKSSPLIGLTEEQQNIIATIMLFHRKSMPSIEDIEFRALAPRNRVAVIKLCVLLRLADALDVSHSRRVDDIRLERKNNGWVLELLGHGDLMLERWTLEKRQKLFQEVFGVRLEIKE